MSPPPQTSLAALAAVSALFLLMTGSCTARKDSLPRPNILLISLDTTRADILSASGGTKGLAPVLDHLASESIQCTLARTPAPLTLPSHASMMTGLYPFAHGVRDNDAYRMNSETETAAALLHDAGYRTEAILASTVLSAFTGLDHGFEHYDDLAFRRARSRAEEAQRRGDDITDRALERLRIRDPRPFFLWVHYFDPHAPYNPPGYEGNRADRVGYEEEIRYLDRQIGRLLDFLDENRLHENTLIVVVGDHGEGLGDVQEITHGLLCEEPTLRIPLLVRLPKAELRGTLSWPTSAVDVFTTLLAQAGVELPYAVHGKDVVDLFERAQKDDSAGDPLANRPVYFETWRGYNSLGWARLEGIADSRWKYVSGATEELFDLAAPGGERDNRAGQAPEVLGMLRSRFDELREEVVADFEMTPATLTPAENARLVELGYLSRMAETDPTDLEQADLPDPRSHYRVYVAYQMATLLGGKRRYAEAAQILEKVVAVYPKNPTFRDILGRTYVKLESPDQAIPELQEAIRLDPNRITSAFFLARAFVQAGRFVEAVEWFERTLELYSGHLDAHLELRDLHERFQRFGPALLETLEIVQICDEIDDPGSRKLRAENLQQASTLLDELRMRSDREQWYQKIRAAFEALPDEARGALLPLLSEVLGG